MVFVRVEFLDDLAGVIESLSGVHHDVAAFTLDARVHAHAAEVRHFVRVFSGAQIVDLVEDRGRRIVVADDLRIRHLSGVVESETTPDAHDTPRQSRLAE